MINNSCIEKQENNLKFTVGFKDIIKINKFGIQILYHFVILQSKQERSHILRATISIAIHYGNKLRKSVFLQHFSNLVLKAVYYAVFKIVFCN